MKYQIKIKWHIDDIKNYMKSCGYKKTLDTQDLCAILKTIEDNHDSNVGINWDVIGYYVDMYIESLED